MVGRVPLDVSSVSVFSQRKGRIAFPITIV